MPDMSAPLKLGANCWNQYTDWPVPGSPPCSVPSAWGTTRSGRGTTSTPSSARTRAPSSRATRPWPRWPRTPTRATIGLMVGANTFRNPALVAKMVTTLDHISGGRAVLGIGAAWFETEHTAFGIAFGDGPGGAPALAGRGAAHHARHARRHARPPCIGARYRTEARAQPAGAGPGAPAHPHRRQRSAGHAQAGGALRATSATSVAPVRTSPRRKRSSWRTARRSGATSGRSSAPSGMGVPVIRDTQAEARRVVEALFAHNGGARPWTEQPVGTVDEVVAHCAPFVELGYRHLVFGFPAPYDEETMTRLATEVRPRLEALHPTRAQEGGQMPDMKAPLKLGANLWNQYTDWPAFLDGMLRAEDLGYDSLWTWDHVYPIVGGWEGPALETYTAMAAVAAQTKRATIGHLVGANTFRNPALLAKMITTIDHISDGRAVLGIGAAWMEPEHTAFGIEYGDRPGTRLRWLAEALPIVRGMLDGTRPSSPPAAATLSSRRSTCPRRSSGASPSSSAAAGRR